MRTTALCLLALASSALAGSWCHTGPVPKGKLATIHQEVGAEFRGSFRDFALFVSSSSAAGCTPFASHSSGNDGLWVLEFRSPHDKVRELAKVHSNGLSVLLETNMSAVVQGGEEVPDKLGYDACGAEKLATVLTVSPHAVVPQTTLAGALKDYADRTRNTRIPSVQNAIDLITVADMAATVTHLENYNSRNSYTGSDLPAATQWLAGQYSAVGFNVSRHQFRTIMAQQVIADFPGYGPNAGIVIIGAHSDSRSTQVANPTQRAPGADDNGSGTAALVLIARALRNSGIRLRHTIRLISFTGEEQGLLGSRAIAAQYRQNNENIVAMVNGDMIGYRLPGQPITLAYMDRNANLEWSEWSRDIIAQYVPDLLTGWTQACCSDQQAFHEQGYPAIGLFEHPGGFVMYPQYHTSSDLLQYLDQTQLMLQAKAMMASALIFAQPHE